MVRLTIDSHIVEVPEGTSILDAAKSVQIKIPTLCHHPDLPPTAACGICIVKVNGILREERVDEAYLQRWEAAVAAQTAKQHGEVETGCDSEKAARGETGNTVAERIADFREKIAARKAAVGKEYLSFYYVEAISYEVVEQ